MYKRENILTKQLTSFRYAFKGLSILFKTERNARIHLFITTLVIIAGQVRSISTLEWAVIWLCFGLVISLEAINSSIEGICDFIMPDLHPEIGKIKDLAAGAVLWAAICSGVVGLIIFFPKM